MSVAIDGTTLKLSTVTYKPAGDGPFPTLIFHHGSGDFAHPYDPHAIAQWFVGRGWAVIAPSRRGRGGSEGLNEEGADCSVASAVEGADRSLGEIEAVSLALVSQPFVDRRRIAVGGESRGGVGAESIPRCAPSSISSEAGRAPGLACTPPRSIRLS